jgi:hypothetical protein
MNLAPAAFGQPTRGLVPEWIDPREIDWTDGLNPIRNPGWRITTNPYAYAAMQDQFLQALRQAHGIQARIFVCPDPSAQLITAGATIDYEVPAEPNTWLWGINASGNASNFLLNVSDSVTGVKLFNQPIRMTDLCAARTGTAGRGPIFFLSTPWLFQPPSYPVVRIINTNISEQTCRVTLFTSCEYDL